MFKYLLTLSLLFSCSMASARDIRCLPEFIGKTNKVCIANGYIQEVTPDGHIIFQTTERLNRIVISAKHAKVIVRFTDEEMGSAMDEEISLRDIKKKCERIELYCEVTYEQLDNGTMVATEIVYFTDENQ